jgi:hypothetical protein
MLANVSSLVNTNWILGIPFNQTNPFRLAIAQYGVDILGKNLVGLEVGEQPDNYALSGLRSYVRFLSHCLHCPRLITTRSQDYTPSDYKSEFSQLVSAMQRIPNSSLDHASKLLIGPNINGGWTPEQVWYTGFINDQKDSLAALSVEKYAPLLTSTRHLVTSTP